jgi:hypothetical protein
MAAMDKFILAVVIVGLVLTIGIYITEQIGNQMDTDDTTATVTGENVTLNAVIGTYTNFVYNPTDYENAVCTSVAVVNASNVSQVLPADNYTTDSAHGNCRITAANASDGWNGTGVTVNYTATYSAATQASNASDDVVEALGSGTAWVTILVVVGFATIVLGLLTGGLGQATEGGLGAGREVAYTY